MAPNEVSAVIEALRVAGIEVSSIQTGTSYISLHGVTLPKPKANSESEPLPAPDTGNSTDDFFTAGAILAESFDTLFGAFH
jgi:hypothetical protein